MKKAMFKHTLYNLLVLTVALFLSGTAIASNEGYALLIQSSPPNAGTVTPGLGIHKMQIGQTVALSAVPEQGYRFLYWLGDVSSTDGPYTTVSVDSPKLVVAVFTKEKFDDDLPVTAIGITDGQYASGSSQRGYYNPIQSPGSVSPGTLPVDYDYIQSDTQTDDDIPVPGDNGEDDDIPVPGDNEIPEPATVLLMALGSTMLLKERKHGT